MSRPAVVGRVLDAATLPGGAALIAKAARNAGGWIVWASSARVLRPVKVVAAKDAPDGTAVFEDQPHEQMLLKGRRADPGRSFVVMYLRPAGEPKWKIERAYVFTTHHTATVPGGLLSLSNTKERKPDEVHHWTSERPTYDPSSVTGVKTYIAEEGAP